MSYSFTVVKDVDGLRIDESASTLTLIPDGKWQVSGHLSAPGMSRTANLAVTQIGADGHHVATVVSGGGAG
jgi:hypothetical protein